MDPATITALILAGVAQLARLYDLRAKAQRGESFTEEEHAFLREREAEERERLRRNVEGMGG